MLFYPHEKIGLFVDGVHAYMVSRTGGWHIDYKLLLESLARKGTLVHAFYYTAVFSDSSEYSATRSLLDFLSYNGWIVRTRVGHEFQNAEGEKRVKGNMDVDLAVDAMNAARWCDHIVIFHGAATMSALVEALQREGKRVTIISSILGESALCADELRRRASGFVEIEDLRTAIERKEKPKKQQASSE